MSSQGFEMKLKFTEIRTSNIQLSDSVTEHGVWGIFFFLKHTKPRLTHHTFTKEIYVEKRR